MAVCMYPNLMMEIPFHMLSTRPSIFYKCPPSCMPGRNCSSKGNPTTKTKLVKWQHALFLPLMIISLVPLTTSRNSWFFFLLGVFSELICGFPNTLWSASHQPLCPSFFGLKSMQLLSEAVNFMTCGLKMAPRDFTIAPQNPGLHKDFYLWNPGSPRTWVP